MPDDSVFDAHRGTIILMFVSWFEPSKQHHNNEVAMNKVDWTNTVDKLPDQKGYYYTYYYNNNDKQYFYKAIWWNGKHWINWRPSENKFIETVERYIEKSRNDYYCPCVEWVEKNMSR
jgi:hypothetical protein